MPDPNNQPDIAIIFKMPKKKTNTNTTPTRSSSGEKKVERDENGKMTLLSTTSEAGRMIEALMTSNMIKSYEKPSDINSVKRRIKRTIEKERLLAEKRSKYGESC